MSLGAYLGTAAPFDCSGSNRKQRSYGSGKDLSLSVASQIREAGLWVFHAARPSGSAADKHVAPSRKGCAQLVRVMKVGLTWPVSLSLRMLALEFCPPCRDMSQQNQQRSWIKSACGRKNSAKRALPMMKLR